MPHDLPYAGPHAHHLPLACTHAVCGNCGRGQEEAGCPECQGLLDKPATPQTGQAPDYVVEDTERLRTVRWPDGWWTFRRFIPVGLLPMLAPFADKIKEGEALGLDLALTLPNQLLLTLTTAWAYGPVDEATLMAEVPLHHADVVAEMVTVLLSPFLLAGVGASVSYSPSPSSAVAASPTISPSATS